MNILSSIDQPSRLRDLDNDQLSELCDEIRSAIIDTVADHGGHLGSNLGVVELTVALHRMFDSPAEPILFDTGHQTYPHKLLTGRAEQFDTLRVGGGMSGYASRAESCHDVIENSHASTSLCYADGLAKANTVRGDNDRSVVVVIGDGALSGGMAWEGLNNIGGSDERVVVVLNDNGRSYAPTIGGIANHLRELNDHTANRSIFEELGFTFVGPVNGHDIAELETALGAAKAVGRPALVHVKTHKGCGYSPAEQDDDEKFHAPGTFDVRTGIRTTPAKTTWTDVFSSELVRQGEERDDIVALTAAMPGPTGLANFAQKFPDRFFDVGIAEQHAVAASAGLAMGGLHPVFAVYATFLNRAFDQVLMDVALHRLGVTFVLDRAGVTGDDGASHNGMWDLSAFQVVPGLRMAAPRDAATLRELLREAVAVSDEPTLVRFPKGSPPADLPVAGTVGGVDVLRRTGTSDVLVVAVGAMAGTGLEVADLLHGQSIGSTVVDPRWVKPLDPGLAQLASGYRYVVVLEDNCAVGGVGDAVARLLRDHEVEIPVWTFGIPAQFLEHGKRPDLFQQVGLDSRFIVRSITERLARCAASRWTVPADCGSSYGRAVLTSRQAS
ncbi:MAG: 1-deoxy-D-xylulose-5-phosphate synthase [Jatrophihabitans sp.]